MADLDLDAIKAQCEAMSERVPYNEWVHRATRVAADVPVLVAKVERLRAERDDALASLRAEQEELLRLRAAVSLHRTDAGYVCLGCAHWWPCPTVRAANGEGDRGDA